MDIANGCGIATSRTGSSLFRQSRPETHPMRNTPAGIVTIAGPWPPDFSSSANTPPTPLGPATRRSRSSRYCATARASARSRDSASRLGPRSCSDASSSAPSARTGTISNGTIPRTRFNDFGTAISTPPPAAKPQGLCSTVSPGTRAPGVRASVPSARPH